MVNTVATQLPFEDGSFDRYLSNLGLCCTPDLTAKLSEVWRSPGAVLVPAPAPRTPTGE